ncbi:unnamed protein product [Caretta caretta]
MAAAQEHSQILVNLWCKASKTVDFSKSTRNDHTYQQIANKLAALQIFQTGDWYREHIKRLKSKYWKTRDKNHILGNSPTTCALCDYFDRVLGIAPSTEPTMLHGDLVSRNGALNPAWGLMGASSRFPMRIMK